MSAEQLDKILEVCRKHGVLHLKTAEGIEVQLTPFLPRGEVAEKKGVRADESLREALAFRASG